MKCVYVDLRERVQRAYSRAYPASAVVRQENLNRVTHRHGVSPHAVYEEPEVLPRVSVIIAYHEVNAKIIGFIEYFWREHHRKTEYRVHAPSIGADFPTLTVTGIT